MPKKTEKGDSLGFFSTYAVAKHQKNEGEPLAKKCGKKSRNAEKKLKRGTL